MEQKLKDLVSIHVTPKTLRFKADEAGLTQSEAHLFFNGDSVGVYPVNQKHEVPNRHIRFDFSDGL